MATPYPLLSIYLQEHYFMEVLSLVQWQTPLKEYLRPLYMTTSAYYFTYLLVEKVRRGEI